MRYSCTIALALAAGLVTAACEQPKDSEPAEDQAGAEATEETIVVPPTVSEDAPSEPHKGEPPSPNQPQPVVPEDAAAEPEAPAAAEDDEAMEETVVVPPTVSEDAPSEPHKGEPPSPNQPQPVYPDEAAAEPEAPAAETDSVGALWDMVMPGGNTVVVDEAAETIVVQPTVSADAPSEPHTGEPPSPKQPQPVYPDGEPDGQ